MSGDGGSDGNGSDRPGADDGSDRPGADNGSDRPGVDDGSDRPGADDGSDRPGADDGSDRPGADDGSDRPGADGGPDTGRRQGTEGSGVVEKSADDTDDRGDGGGPTAATREPANPNDGRTGDRAGGPGVSVDEGGADGAPSPEPSAEDGPPVPAPGEDPVRWFLRTDSGVAAFVREVVYSVLTVALIAGLLFGISGLWPPLVAVESGSMEPHMHRGDLVFVIENGRFAPSYAEGATGVVTYRTGEDRGYRTFGAPGDVVIYRPDGSSGATPIIHRARFRVDEGDNWVAEANPQYLGQATTCAQVPTCPAPHDGLITKGDNNPRYDQIGGQSTVVQPDWVRGVAKVRVPWLGRVRLGLG